MGRGEHDVKITSKKNENKTLNRGFVLRDGHFKAWLVWELHDDDEKADLKQAQRSTLCRLQKEASRGRAYYMLQVLWDRIGNEAPNVSTLKLNPSEKSGNAMF